MTALEKQLRCAWTCMCMKGPIRYIVHCEIPMRGCVILRKSISKWNIPIVNLVTKCWSIPPNWPWIIANHPKNTSTSKNDHDSFDPKSIEETMRKWKANTNIKININHNERINRKCKCRCRCSCVNVGWDRQNLLARANGGFDSITWPLKASPPNSC